MESDLSPSGSVTEGDFGFAFNDVNFSDRLLLIEISGVESSTSDLKPDYRWLGCSSVVDWVRDRKRRRDDVTFDRHAFDSVACHYESDMNSDQPETDDCLGQDNEREETTAVVEEAQAGNGEDSYRMDRDSSRGVRVTEIHISSPILAAKSPFFYKLFSNGMRESEQRHVVLRINASEEAAVMELLKFMYSNSVSITTVPSLLSLLMVADKFEVASCMKYCCHLLRNIPLTPQSALLYLDLPPSVLMAEVVQPLIDAAKQFLASRYRDISRCPEEVKALPLAGMEAILSSDSLQVSSEDMVYDFVMKWARSHYPEAEERREILSTRLARFIRFPHMTSRKLKKVLNANEFDPKVITKVVLEALFFKAEVPHKQRTMAAQDHKYVERAYKYQPVKVLEFQLPWPHCVVFLDMKREQCAKLFPTGRIYSFAFHLGGQGFFLSAHCNMDQTNSFHCFGLFLGMQDNGAVSFSVDYEFAVRTKPKEDFVSKYKGNYKFMGGKAVGYRNLFTIPWSAFMADDSLYFLNGVLHLRAELSIRLQPR